MDHAGNEPTAELRIGGWLPPIPPAGDAPTQQLPKVGDAATELIPVVASDPAGARPRTHSRWTRSGRWALVAAAAAALASVPVALFATSDSRSRPPASVLPRWPVGPTVLASEPGTATPTAGAAAPGVPPRVPAAGTPPADLAQGARTSAPPTPSTSPTPEKAVSYEAEAPGNQLDGRAQRRNMAGASGGAGVGWIGGQRSNRLRFTGVTAARNGSYRVTIHYVSGERRYADVAVNGQSTRTVEFASVGDWSTIGTTTVTVELRAGANTIDFGHPYRWAPDLDRIVVTPLQ